MRVLRVVKNMEIKNSDIHIFDKHLKNDKFQINFMINNIFINIIRI